METKKLMDTSWDWLVEHLNNQESRLIYANIICLMKRQNIEEMEFIMKSYEKFKQFDGLLQSNSSFKESLFEALLYFTDESEESKIRV